MDLLTKLNIDGSNPLSVSGLGTAIKFFGAVSGIVPASKSATAGFPGYLVVPGSNELNGKRFQVRAAGDLTCGVDVTSPTATITLAASKNIQPNVNNSPVVSTLASYTAPAAGLGLTTLPWFLIADLLATTASGILEGSYSLQLDNGSVQSGAITALSGVSMSASTPIAFLIGLTWSQTGQGNRGNLYQFSLQS